MLTSFNTYSHMKTIAIIFALGLVLMGCATKQPQPTPPMPPVPPKATVAPRKAIIPKATTAPTITVGLTNVIGVPGGNLTFNVSATGNGLTYVWKFNGNTISGATSSTYTATNVQTSGTYSVTVSNSSGTDVSSAYAAVGTTTIVASCVSASPITKATITWCPSLDLSVMGYKLYYGATNPPIIGWTPDIYDPNQPACVNTILIHGTNWYRAYTNVVDARNNTTATVSNLTSGVTYYFTTTSYDVNGIESPFSEEISLPIPLPIVPPPPSNVTLSIMGIAKNTVLLSCKVCPQTLVTIQYKDRLNDPSWSTLVSNSHPDTYGNFFLYDPSDKNQSRFYQLSLQ